MVLLRRVVSLPRDVVVLHRSVVMLSQQCCHPTQERGLGQHREVSEQGSGHNLLYWRGCHCAADGSSHVTKNR